MAENVLKLKKQAVSLGMSKDDAKRAARPALEAFIAGATAAASKGDGATVTKKKKGKKRSENTTAAAPAKKKKRGRPAGSKNAPERKAKKEAPKRKQSRKAAENDSGRLEIGSIDWKVESDEWNPREGGPVELLFKALKKAKGDIDKAFDIVRPDMYDFIGRNKRDGTRRTKQEAEAMLRYRLNRTKFEYARRTGQHESATNRVEYGSGDYAKPKRGRPAKKAENKKAAPIKRNSGSKKKKTKNKKR